MSRAVLRLPGHTPWPQPNPLKEVFHACKLDATEGRACARAWDVESFI